MRKPWHHKIQKHVDHWSRRLSWDAWWPKYLYYFADIRNALSILEGGNLYCRSEALKRGLIVTNGASQSVIQQTPSAHKRFVRLYFRPRTPTQYHSEGIRPLNQRSLDAHCPVPIFFLFDSYELLSRIDTEFSNGNMASSYVRYGPDEGDFDVIPFEKVFHRGVFGPDARSEIIFHRHAEVLIPNALMLDGSLKAILCRSRAEWQTLLYMLSLKALKRFRKIIRMGVSSLFERTWAFIDKVEANNGYIMLHFNHNSRHRDLFKATLALNYSSGKPSATELDIDARNGISVPLDEDEVEIEVWLDDALAYKNMIWAGDTPV
jgi:hypothetical protein